MKQRENANSNAGGSIAKSLRTYWPIAVAVIIIDQLTKLLVVVLLPTLVIKNTGTAFGLFKGNNIAVTVISLVVIAFLVRHILKHETGDKRQRLFTAAFMLIIGGGAANILDRLLRGYVVDFIRLPLWPAFNIADFCVSVGITVLVWYSFFQKKPQKEIANPPEATV